MKSFSLILVFLIGMHCPADSSLAGQTRFIQSELELKFAPARDAPQTALKRDPTGEAGNASWFGEVEATTYRNGERLLDINIARLALPAGARLHCKLNGKLVLTLVLGERGFTGAELSTAADQQVPPVSAGDIMTVESGGIVLLTGQFIAD